MDFNDISKPVLHTQDSPLGYQIINMFWNWFYRVIRVCFLKKHHPNGDFNTRQVAFVTGRYKFDGGAVKFNLEAQNAAGFLPGAVTPLSPGEVVIGFNANMPSALYDIQVTGAVDADGWPLLFGYNANTSDETQVELRFKAFDNTPKNPGGFTITLFSGSN
jgi:hypothetical protein